MRPDGMALGLAVACARRRASGVHTPGIADNFGHQ